MANKKLFAKTPKASEDTGPETVHIGGGNHVYAKAKKTKPKIEVTSQEDVTEDAIPLAMPSAESKTKPAKKEKKTKPAKEPKAPKAKKEPKEKKLSLLSAAAQILQGNDGKPMTVADLVDAATKKGLWTPGDGKTPTNSLYAAISREINEKGKDSRFAKAVKGEKGFRAAKGTM